MRFVDRKNELVRLMRLSSAGDGGLAVVWGRRRIGKSELLKEWCRRVSDGLYTVGEAKWSGKAFTAAEVRRFANALAVRPLPAHFPSDAVRVLFLASVEKGVPSKIGDVSIVDAEEVCSGETI